MDAVVEDHPQLAHAGGLRRVDRSRRRARAAHRACKRRREPADRAAVPQRRQAALWRRVQLAADEQAEREAEGFDGRVELVVLPDVGEPVARAQRSNHAAPARGQWHSPSAAKKAATAASVVRGNREASRRWRPGSKIACREHLARARLDAVGHVGLAAPAVALLHHVGQRAAPGRDECEPLERDGRERGGGAVGGRLARIFGMEVGVKGRTVGPERVAERVRRGVEEFGRQRLLVALAQRCASRAVRLHTASTASVGVGSRSSAPRRTKRATETLVRRASALTPCSRVFRAPRRTARRAQLGRRLCRISPA